MIYYDNATLPTLYMGINMMTHDKPIFMYMGRLETLDTNNIPNNVTMVTNDDEMESKIAELNVNNPQATFTFYMNDLRIAKVFSHFYAQGISEDRIRVIMISDGVGTYGDFEKKI